MFLRLTVGVNDGRSRGLRGPTHTRVVAEGVAGAELVILPNCGHTPGMETPDAYRRAIFDWLDRTG